MHCLVIFTSRVGLSHVIPEARFRLRIGALEGKPVLQATLITAACRLQTDTGARTHIGEILRNALFLTMSLGLRNKAETDRRL